MKFSIILIVALAACVSAKAIEPKSEKASFIDSLTAALNEVIQTVIMPAVNIQVQNIALLGAQMLAGLSQTGLAGIGKRDIDPKGLTDFLDAFQAALTQVVQTVIMPAVNTQVQNIALLGAQMLAGLSQTGLAGIGKRSDEELKISLSDLFSQLGQQLTASLYPIVDQAFQSLALTGAQILAGIATGGVGKRDLTEAELKGISDFFTQLGNQLAATLLPQIDTALQGLALTGAQILAGIAINGIGKRELTEEELKGFSDFFTQLGNQLAATFLPIVDGAVQSLALTGAQILAVIAQNGVGKRELTEEAKNAFINSLSSLLGDLTSTITSSLNTQVQNLALLGAQLLAGLSQTGLGLGK